MLYISMDIIYLDGTNLLGVRPISMAASFQTAEVLLWPCPFSLRWRPAHNDGRVLMASMIRPRMLLCNELGRPNFRGGVATVSEATVAGGGTSPVKAVYVMPWPWLWGGWVIRCGSWGAVGVVAVCSQLKLPLGRPRPWVAVGNGGGATGAAGSSPTVAASVAVDGASEEVPPPLPPLDWAPTIFATVMLYMKDMGSKCSHLVLNRSLWRIWRWTKLW